MFRAHWFLLITGLISCTHQGREGLGYRRAPSAQSIRPCSQPNETSQILLSSYRWLATTTSAPNVEDRQSMGLQSLSASDVSLVDNPTICSRAIVAFNRAFEPDPPTTKEVHVLRFGATRYVVVDEYRRAGEWIYRATFDSSFRQVLSRGRE